MELLHVRSFVAVAESQSVSEAAKFVHSSQPTLSRQISTLQRDLGARLFGRSGGRMRLTAAGEVFLVEARRLLAMADEAVYAVNALSRKKETLRVGYLPSVLYAFVGSALLEVKKRFPDIDIQLTEAPPSQQFTLIEHGLLDVAFPCSAYFSDKLIVEKLSATPLIIALPHQHPLLKGDGGNLAVYADETFYVPLDHSPPDLGALVRNLCRSVGMEPRILSSGSMSSVLVKIALGEGVGIMPSYCALLPHSGVKFRRLLNPRAVTDSVAITPLGPRSPLVQSFIDMARRCAVERSTMAFWDAKRDK